MSSAAARDGTLYVWLRRGLWAGGDLRRGPLGPRKAGSRIPSVSVRRAAWCTRPVGWMTGVLVVGDSSADIERGCRRWYEAERAAAYSTYFSYCGTYAEQA